MPGHTTAAGLSERAAAKVNLTLHVGPRGADGYHPLQSLVAFAQEHDLLTLQPGADGAPSLRTDGPFAAAAGPDADNLVLQAARALQRRIPQIASGHFRLTKNIPAAAGLGGGSADAAAALRLLARLNAIAAADPRLTAAARDTGADVPVCLDPKPRTMRGRGDVLSPPLAMPALHAVLVNPGAALATRDVFAAFDAAMDVRSRPLPAVQDMPATADADRWLAVVAAAGNDLEGAAVALQPAIADVLSALRATAGCRLARMSGSGATCFGLYSAADAADAAARGLQTRHPGWWIRATRLGAG